MNVQLDNIAEKKSAILQGTLALIKDNGFHGTSMSMIAQKAGVAAGTIYHYFESKDALMIELFLYLRDAMTLVMLKDDTEEKDFKERFFSYWMNLCNYYIDNPSALMYFEQYSSSPYVRQEICSSNHSRSLKNVFGDLFKSGMEKGYIKNVGHELLAPIVYGSIVTAAKFHINGKHDFTEADLYKIVELIWEGIKIRD